MDVINMEVRIKQGNKMLDATIEMVDGVMVVSPKVELFEPENGDIVTTNGGEHIFLCKDYIGEGDIYAYLGYDFNLCSWFKKGEWSAERYATKEEKKKLFDKLAEEGLEWDAEKKELVKLKWEPADHEKVYVAGFTFYGKHPFCPFEDKAFSDSMQWRSVFERGWYFKTQEKCQEFCDRLNDAINQINP